MSTTNLSEKNDYDRLGGDQTVQCIAMTLGRITLNAPTPDDSDPNFARTKNDVNTVIAAAMTYAGKADSFEACLRVVAGLYLEHAAEGERHLRTALRVRLMHTQDQIHGEEEDYLIQLRAIGQMLYRRLAEEGKTKAA